MAFDNYYEARTIIEDIIRRDLLGPVEDNEIISGERPLDYYILGKLYPRDFFQEEGAMSSADDCGSIDEEGGISLCNGKEPSSFGVSFSLNPGDSSFSIFATAARYTPVAKDGNKLEGGEMPKGRNMGWRREILDGINVVVDADTLAVGDPLSYTVGDHLLLKVMLHRILRGGSKIITVSMINEYSKSDDYAENNARAYFQPKIIIRENSPNSFGDVVHRKHLNADKELQELDMLYRDIRNFASGHGCAVSWEKENDLLSISSEFLPKYEVKQMKPSMQFSGRILSMKYLATASKEDICSGLSSLVMMYRQWITRQQETVSGEDFLHKDVGTSNLEKCIKTANRMQKSIDALRDDPNVFKAFALANKAMFDQRKQSLINAKKYDTDEKIRWYPFQLAFFVQELCSFALPESAERKDVDLLWFPTGGGKTEAYLGIAAFVIFLRRLRGRGDGVTILMRYTMRLLTFQQFERAATLICACELIRRNERIPGGEIGIGLWAGQALTPNTIEKAEKILNGELVSGEENGNPRQIRKCPWCGATIPDDNYVCDRENSRMIVKCGDPRCCFHSGLPVHLIDEDIYEHTPTYIVATIDKFAQVALNEQCVNLFGTKRGYRPPELIIQDELHLISGPLGTITGLYEAAICKLCEHEGISAKVIASTATIRNAKEQILGLYGADYTQFPPQGINIDDSFFAEISTRAEKPARMYLGCMGIGTSPTTMMIRAMASMLYGSRYLCEVEKYDENVIDAYWTITSYFNSLRELGGAIVRVVDDIQDRFKYLKASKFAKAYPVPNAEGRYDKYKELTSREKSEDIGKVIQEELVKKYRKDGSEYPYDFVLASNMISVGVDVGRLGTMIVVGQPKSTAEYIQATSRVGRENPGLVLTTYNQAKSRDRSHYEQFGQFHSSFYKYVEATSITPFADRARDRALQTLYVILCRYYIPQLFSDKDAVNYRRDLPGLSEIRKYIFDYVTRVDPDELENVKSEIEDIEDAWEAYANSEAELHYKYNRHDPGMRSLFAPDYEEDSRFRVLNTMRSVETTVNVKVKE